MKAPFIGEEEVSRPEAVAIRAQYELVVRAFRRLGPGQHLHLPAADLVRVCREALYLSECRPAEALMLFVGWLGAVRVEGEYTVSELMGLVGLFLELNPQLGPLRGNVLSDNPTIWPDVDPDDSSILLNHTSTGANHKRPGGSERGSDEALRGSLEG